MIVPTGQLDRALPGAPCALSLTPETPAGTPYTLTAPATIVVRDSVGGQVHSGDATVSEDKRTLSVTLPPTTFSALDSYAVTWSVTAGSSVMEFGSELETCGGFLFSIASFRGDSARKEFASMDPARLLRARTLAERAFEKECRVAFVPRACRETLRGSGRDVLILSKVALRRLYAVEIDGNAMSESEVAQLTCDEPGLVTRPAGAVWPALSTVTVYYEHGYDRPDDPVTDAVQRLAREYLFPDTKLPPRAVLQNTEYGNFRLATPDDEHPFGIPDVDAVYRTYRRDLPGVG